MAAPANSSMVPRPPKLRLSRKVLLCWLSASATGARFIWKPSKLICVAWVAYRDWAWLEVRDWATCRAEGKGEVTERRRFTMPPSWSTASSGGTMPRCWLQLWMEAVNSATWAGVSAMLYEKKR